MGFIELTLELTALFAAAALAAYIIHRAPWKKPRTLELADGLQLRLRSPNGMHRTRILAQTERGWRISAPLNRDAFVPIREGESVTVETPTENGLLYFRTHVAGRDVDSHTLEIERPQQWFSSERREAKRLADVNTLSVRLEDTDARLLDLSEHGMRLLVTGRFARGERVGLTVSWTPEPIFAWVLEAKPAAVGQRQGVDLRLRLEEPLDLAAVRA